MIGLYCIEATDKRSFPDVDITVRVRKEDAVETMTTIMKLFTLPDGNEAHG